MHRARLSPSGEFIYKAPSYAAWGLHFFTWEPCTICSPWVVLFTRGETLDGYSMVVRVFHSKNDCVSSLHDTTKCQSNSHCQHGRIVQLQNEDENSANVSV